MTERKPVDDALDEASLVALFRRVGRFMARAFHRHDQARHAQGHVLALIRTEGPLRQSALLERLDVRSSSLSEVLGKLERQGLIVRERDEADRRGYVITATPLAEAHGPWREEPDGGDAAWLFACLDDTEREQLRGLLVKIARSLQDDPACRDGLCRHGGRGGRLPGRVSAEDGPDGWERQGARGCRGRAPRGRHRHG